MIKRLLILSLLFVVGFVSMSVIGRSKTFEKKVLPQSAWVNNQLSKLTLEQKIGQFFMVAAYSNRGESHFQMLDSAIVEQKIGGLIFFQGHRSNLKIVIDRFQKKTDVPLLIGMDAEWGVHMRLFGEDRFPYNYTIGAANDLKLTREIAEMIAEVGVHMNFAPVADVNSNPDNPVIGFRSFGENPVHVSKHVSETVKGMESQGILTSIKHFPGHGDTDSDSHYKLPLVNNNLSSIDAVDFAPFRAGIRAGASSVMIGHLNVPALDSTGTPSSLSREVIQKYLKQSLGFNGLVISDALNMKAVSERYGKTDVVVKAFQAGCDILLFPESISDAIKAIKSKVETGEISEEEIDLRCRKVLAAKYKSIIAPTDYKIYNKHEIKLAKRQLYEKAITVIKNENEALPIKRFDQRIARISIGTHTFPLEESMDLVTPIDHFHFYSIEEAKRRLRDTLNSYDIVITALHAKTVRPRGGFGMPDGWQEWVNELAGKKKILVLFGNPLALKGANLDKVDGIVCGYENHAVLVDRMGQFLMGTYGSKGRLPITIDAKYKREYGIQVPWAGRMKESQPEELGISRFKLSEIDRIIDKGISAKAFPGCQVVIAIDGKVILRKSYGYHTYDEKRAVTNTDVYDIASITKIAASTASLMRLNTTGNFTLNSTLSTYIPNLTEGTSYSSMRLKSMLSHQAGLVAWIPFYKKTLLNHAPNPLWYSNVKTSSMDIQVSEDLWIKSSYTDSIYQRILSTSLRRKKYKYSDLGYYFVRKIVEKQSGKALNDFAMDEFYIPMGLKYMRYHPTDYFPLYKITPTENDTIFRKDLIHGYVHDPGAAMIGGVGGHAGLFSNAGDLAAMMQMFLNNGTYGGEQYISESVINEYTGCQYCPSNRRGAGFDKPVRNRRGGPSSNLASLSSFGHSGFTGTLAWADPVHKVNYVFLSNRVYPNAENWKIVKMSTRTEIQRVIYEALSQAKK